MYGYRIVEVAPNSPVSETDLMPFVDFIVSVGGVRLVESQMTLQELVKPNENCTVVLEVYSLLTETMRDVPVVPRTWEGDGLLGLTMRYEDALAARDQIYHVTNVTENSPADRAGVQAETDYIVGSPNYSIKELDDLEFLAKSQAGLVLSVYSTATQQVRLVTIRTGYPNAEGSLGLELGMGMLHHLSKRAGFSYMV